MVKTRKSLTPGKGGVNHSVKKPVKSKENLSVKKPIAKSKDNSKSASKKKSVVKALGEQVLSSVKSKIITSMPPTVGMEVQVKWADSTTYTATVVKMEEEECLVHYKGWNKKHDEWIEISPRRGRKRAAFTELKIDHKSNMGKLNAIKSIKKDVDASEGVVYSDNSEKGSDDDDPEMAGLCEYEKIRLRNIREREAMFEELKISEAKSDLSQMFTPTTQNKQGPSKRGLASKKKEKEILPARKSSRISGGLVPEIQRFVPLLSDPVEEKEVPLHSLPLADTFSSSDLVTLADTQQFLTNIAKSNTEKTKISFNSNSLKSSCSSLSVTEELVAKVVPERIFSLAVHPSPDTLIAAAGDKRGCVGLWDILATTSPGHGVHLYQPHTRPVNSLSWDMANKNNLVSTSYDGTTRMLDMEKQEHVMIYGEKEFLYDGGWTTCHAQRCPDTFLVSQGTSGTVVMVDRRVSWEKPVSIAKLFDRVAPKSVSVHPVQNNYFLVGNNKAGVFIFDIRNASTSATSQLITPVSELIGHTRSLSSCQFSPVTGNQVVTMGSDDKVMLFNTSTMAKTIAPQCKVKHNNQTGRWLTPFRSSWHPTREGMLVTGSMERPRQIEVWGTASGSLDLAARLRGEFLGSICSLVEIHPTKEVVVGGNSSGRVHVFM